jgi:Phosphodiester glycosidase
MSLSRSTAGGGRRVAPVAALVALVVALAAALVGAAGGGPAAAGSGGLAFANQERIAPGVEYRDFTLTASHGPVSGHLLEVDLRDPRVSVDLLDSGAVAARTPLSQLADARHAVAGVNGDFFNISETHPGVAPTGAAVGPAVTHGRAWKAAVPAGQRFGPALPPGTSTQDVIGVGADGRGRVARLALRGAVLTPHGVLDLAGLNQYALAENGVGLFTPAWGTASRTRATCGSDTDRNAPCGTDTEEVTVSGGRVVSETATPGSGPIPPGTLVLVGREGGADALRGLRVGDPVAVVDRLAATSRIPPFRFAIGGFPILAGGHPLDGLDTTVAAVRTAAGTSADGHRLWLLALDGVSETDAGLTIAELAQLLRDLGAAAGVNLDGGGSSTLVAREPGADHVTVRNHPSGVAERPIPEGIGIFVRGR